MPLRIFISAILSWLCPINAFAQSSPSNEALNGKLMVLFMFVILCFGSAFAAYLMAKRKEFSKIWIFFAFFFGIALVIMAFLPSNKHEHVVRCGLCQRSISSQAPRCPSCGHPNASQLSPVLHWIGRMIEGVMVTMVIGVVLLVAYSGPLFRYLTALPDCTSIQGQSELRSAFNEGKLHHEEGLIILDVTNIETLFHQPESISCRAVVTLNDDTLSILS